MSESVILCEGYDDRAFLAEWLTQQRCCEQRTDLNGKKVEGGNFGFRSLEGGFIRIVDCKGDEGVIKQLRDRIQGKAGSGFRKLVVCLDADVPVPTDGSTGFTAQNLLREVQQLVATAKLNADGDVEIPGSGSASSTVSLLRWEAKEDGAADVLPAKQTLERLVCAALVAVHPDRGQAVAAWLEGKPGTTPGRVKEFAWSHMAGWYADKGCAHFYRHVWQDAAIAEQLELRLRTAGAWEVIERLLSP